MFETILIPTDGGSDAIKGAEQGIDLAAQLGATVHGLFVVKEGGNPWEATSMADQHDRAEAYGHEVIAEIGELAAAAGVEFVSAVEFGPRVYEVINDYVAEADVDLIAMGSGYHGEFGGLFGSTADKVLRTAHVPVMVLRRELRERDEADAEPVAL
ncbi:MAG: universal stress protein [Halobacteriales archaeon]|nr:universal stress protein [Halobacteriales archaeon]